MLDATEVAFLERRAVVVPAKNWEVFEAWADRPPQKIAALESLANTDPEWRKQCRLLRIRSMSA